MQDSRKRKPKLRTIKPEQGILLSSQIDVRALRHAARIRLINIAALVPNIAALDEISSRGPLAPQVAQRHGLDLRDSPCADGAEPPRVCRRLLWPNQAATGMALMFWKYLSSASAGGILPMGSVIAHLGSV